MHDLVIVFQCVIMIACKCNKLYAIVTMDPVRITWRSCINMSLIGLARQLIGCISPLPVCMSIGSMGLIQQTALELLALFPS